MPESDPLPSPDEPLTVPLLEEAWREGFPSTWSTQRAAVCVLDAHEGDAARFWRSNAALPAREDGLRPERMRDVVNACPPRARGWSLGTGLGA